jgi:diguanylate cyclase (GGDEF)-like protein
VTIILLSILLQALAALLALAQMGHAGRFRFAWLAISLALLLMVLRRIDALLTLLDGHAANSLNDAVGLAISLFMCGGMLGLRALFTDIQTQQQALTCLATTDPLTGVANRRRILALAQQEICRCARSGRPLAVLMMDLDHFKAVNDRLGHAAGDCVLIGIAQACERSLRQIDAFGRVGGEEFVALLPDTDHDQALAAAERLRTRVATLPDIPAPMTLSIGVAVLDRVTAAAEEELSRLLARADAALYQAKWQGRNCCRLAGDQHRDRYRHPAPDDQQGSGVEGQASP